MDHMVGTRGQTYFICGKHLTASLFSSFWPHRCLQEDSDISGLSGAEFPSSCPFFFWTCSQPFSGYVTFRLPSKDTMQVTQSTQGMMSLFELEKPLFFSKQSTNLVETSDKDRRFETVESCILFTSEDWAKGMYFRIRRTPGGQL